MFFNSTILANQGSMVAAVSLSILIRVVFAENLKITLIIRYYTFYYNIGLNYKRLISITIAVIFWLTSWTIKFTFLGYSFFRILRILDHFSGHTMSASRVSATNHIYRFSWCQVEAMLAVEAFQFDWHLYYLVF